MSYIGTPPSNAFTSLLKQDFSTSATTGYTLDHAVNNANDIALFINFVRQEPTAGYAASGTTLTLTSATASSDDMYCVYLGQALQTVNPANASVGLSQLTATGTKDATTFLRGDNTFASAGGDNSPSFLVKLSGNVTNQAGNATVKAPYNTEVYDTNNAYDNSNYRFTVPNGQGGKYFIFMHQNIREEGQNDNYQYLTARLFKNGSFFTEGQLAMAGNNLAANFNNTASFGMVMELSASNYLEFYIKVYNTASDNFIFMEEGSYAGGFKLIGI